MRRTLPLALAVIMTTGAGELAAQVDYNLWFTTDGAGIQLSNSRYFLPPPPPRAPLLYEYVPVRHSPKKAKKVRKAYKKMRKAEKKYFKAQRKFYKEARRWERGRRYFDWDDDWDDDDD